MLNKKFVSCGFVLDNFSSKPMKYNIKENNHPDWLNKGPRYKTDKMLGLNSFITIMKLDKKWLMKLLTSCSNKYQLWNPNHLVMIKNTSWNWQILAVPVTWHTWQTEVFFVNIEKPAKHGIPSPIQVCQLRTYRWGQVWEQEHVHDAPHSIWVFGVEGKRQNHEIDGVGYYLVMKVNSFRCDTACRLHHRPGPLLFEGGDCVPNGWVVLLAGDLTNTEE